VVKSTDQIQTGALIFMSSSPISRALVIDFQTLRLQPGRDEFSSQCQRWVCTVPTWEFRRTPRARNDLRECPVRSYRLRCSSISRCPFNSGQTGLADCNSGFVALNSTATQRNSTTRAETVVSASSRSSGPQCWSRWLRLGLPRVQLKVKCGPYLPSGPSVARPGNPDHDHPEPRK